MEQNVGHRKTVLAVVNFEGTELGQLEAVLEERGIQIDLRRPYAGDPLPDTSDEHDAIIVLGGGQNALADDHCPWFPHLIELMRGFVERDCALLGICLGSQLLARAYHGENIIGGAHEFGWHEVSLNEAGKADPVFKALPDNFPIFQWHDDTFGLPKDAIRLAGSPVANNQAFRIGRAAYGTQFHFEADRPMVSRWLEEFNDLVAKIGPDGRERIERDAPTLGNEADGHGVEIARAWAALV